MWRRLFPLLVAVVIGSVAAAGEDLAIEGIRARLEALDAFSRDLEAGMRQRALATETADGITSLRKNAAVTIGGTLNTRYFYRSGSVKSKMLQGWDGGNPPAVSVRPNGRWTKMDAARGGDLFIADAKLEGKIDVNDHFDAYFKFDLQSSDNSLSDNAEQYWVRWKNICDSGFGVLVGRDSLKYGMGPAAGVLDSWSGSANGNGYDVMFDALFMKHPNGDPYYNDIAYFGERGMFVHNSLTPYHTTWDHSRVTQITPYWENSDASFKAELSLIQGIDADSGSFARANAGATAKYRSQNYGVGSMTARITWKPIEGLTLVASAMNLHNNRMGDKEFESKNNFAASFGFEYTPCFLDKLTLWGYYQHGWNEGWQKDYDTDLINAGVKYDVTDQFYVFAQGDYLYGKDEKLYVWAQYGGPGSPRYDFHKAAGWAGYVGFGYALPYGANFEAGYRHEKIDYKGSEVGKHFKYKGDTVYAHLGVNF